MVLKSTKYLELIALPNTLALSATAASKAQSLVLDSCAASAKTSTFAPLAKNVVSTLTHF